MKAKKLTQKDKILRHLNEVGSINPLQALREYSIMRLATRVWELKDEGYNISTTMKSSTNRFGEKVRYAEYELKIEGNA